MDSYRQQAGIQTAIMTYRQAGKHADGQSYIVIQAGNKACRQAGRQIGSHTCRQTVVQADRKTDIY